MKINDKQQYLWRAVDQDGEVVDVYLQARRDGAVFNFCNLGRHLVGAEHYRNLRTSALNEWGVVVA